MPRSRPSAPVTGRRAAHAVAGAILPLLAVATVGVALALLVPVPLAAQAPAAAPVVSPLTGVTLPEGARADRGMLKRLAARVVLADVANKSGGALADAPSPELYRLVHRPDLVDATLARFAAAGWTVGPTQPDGDDRFAWLSRGDRHVLAVVTPRPNDAWLYLGAATRGTPTRPVAVTTSTPEATRAPAAAAANTSPQTPASAPTTPAASPPARREVAAAPAAPARSAPSGPRRFAFTTTNFDDGWVATDDAGDGSVSIAKGAIAGRIGVRIPFDDAMRRDVTGWFWEREVASRWRVGATDDRAAELQYMQVDYREAEVTEQGGGAAYVAMLVHKTPAGGAAIVVRARDRATFRAAFPNPQDLERLVGYNRFAVAPADLAGHWSEASGAYTHLYYTATGGYAGMSGATVSAQFWLEADGSYRSEHKGIAQSLGAVTSVNQQEYRGRWTMRGNWELSLTNRFRGATDTFHAHLEVVPGGRWLVLTDASAPGIRYVLGLAR